MFLKEILETSSLNKFELSSQKPDLTEVHLMSHLALL